MKKKLLCRLLAGLMVVPMVLCACGSEQEAASTDNTAAMGNESENASVSGDSAAADGLAMPDMTAWQYDEDSDVYWQVGLSYCANPADESYETLGIFVPGAYMTGTANGDGSYTCEVNADGTVAGYTADTAPVVLPVNTPGYSAMAAPTGFSSDVTSYTSAGFVYVWAGCRGRDAGAPAGVTDLKAAIRYVRYCSELLPGDMDSIFSFGMSGGGAQSALLGATGDSELYTPYLQAIGAIEGVSDAVKGSMCWCPITNLDVADEAYEWNLGATRSDLSDEEQALSDALAKSFASYINELGLTDADGNVLVLEESEEGNWQAGSYYEYLKGVVEESLSHFLSDTEFPYEAASASSGIGGQVGGMGNRGDRGNRDGGPTGDKNGAPTDERNGDLPDGTDGQLPDGAPTDERNGDLPDGMDGQTPGGAPADGQLPDGMDGQTPDGADGTPADGEAAQYALDGVARDTTTSSLSLSGTYETPEDYVAALNADGEWVTYDSTTGEVTISSLESFVKFFKNASKSLGAFDQLDKGQAENTLFGYGDGNGAHFDSFLAEIIANSDYAEEYSADFTADLTATDALGNTVDVRMNMYNPMYYLCDYYEGAGTSTVASYWRIRTGINQSDTSLCTEVDLALALEKAGASVDFETVWGQGHTEAERTGSSSENFIAWVNECMK